jgi:hypothetical protein
MSTRPARVEREAKEPCRVGAVHGGPPVGAVADVRRGTGGAGDLDQRREKAVIARPVHFGRKPHHARANAAPASASVARALA